MVGLYVADATFKSYRKQPHFRYARLIEGKNVKQGFSPASCGELNGDI